MKQRCRLWVMGVVAVLLVAGVIFTGSNSAKAGQTLVLQPPAFVHAASMENSGTPEEIAAMLSDEAGISAYIQTSNPIDLSQVEGEFRTIETQTTEYIIGSVPVPNHPEHFDVHVYVHIDGWILAYYMKDEATGKMVDVRSQTVSSTKLQTIISNIAGSLGESVADLKYYDFRYPNATNILMVAEDQDNGRNFNIEMPIEYGYSERSFAVYNTFDSRGWNIYINGEVVPRSWYGSDMAYGSISAAQLPAGQSHEVSLSSSGSTAYGVLVITYREP